jgi:hypothetical protein
MKMIEPKQIQLLHIAKSQCGLSDDDYRDIIAGQTKGKKTSSKDLTYFEADAVINYFVKTLGFKVKSKYIRTSGAARRSRWQYASRGTMHRAPTRTAPLPDNVTQLPSRDQLDMIDALAEQITWKVEGGFTRWLFKYFHTERITTVAQAQRVTEGLKGMLVNQNKAPSPLRREG